LFYSKVCSDDGLKNMADRFSNGAAWTAANERIEKTNLKIMTRKKGKKLLKREEIYM
jgi:hypothetical protein